MAQPIPQKPDTSAPKDQNYEFFPLLGENPIRLLYLQPGTSSQPLSYTLKSVDLSSQPQPIYSCLSYTWGNPCWEKMDNIFEVANRSTDYGSNPGGRNNKIECDGQIIFVTDNLYSALGRLKNDIAFVGENNHGRLPIWIDSICIHQESTNERNSQVAKMDEIYRNAQKVIVWLGPENKTYTSMAIDVLDRLSAIPEENHNVKLPDGLDSPEIYTILGISPILYGEWTALGELFRRKWFGRIWVIQESFEAQDLIVYCGKHILSWKQIIKVSKLLKEMGLDRTLMNYLNTFPSQTNQNKEKEKKDDLDYDDDNIATDQEKSAGDVDASIYMGNVVHIHELFEDLREQKGNLKLEVLLSYARYFGATNRSDYVYAVRGMWKPSCDDHQTLLDSIKPDYNVAIEEVFTRAAYASIIEIGDLNILSLVEDHSLRIQRAREERDALRKELKEELKDEKDPKEKERKKKEKQKNMLFIKLPSWVPDWSITPIAQTIRIKEPGRWTASKGLRYTPPPQPSDKKLHIKGTCIATIVEKAAREPELIDDIGMEIFALLKFLSNILESHASMSSTLIEAFWKTIIKNTYDEKPVTHEARKSLTSFLAYQVHQIKSELNYPNLQLPPSVKSRLQQIEDLLNNISERDETDTIPTYEVILQIIQKEGSNVEFKGVNKESALFMESFRLAYIGRRLFCTAENESNGILLGLGPESLRTGDEVWVIAGADVPMVLRRQSDRKSEGMWQLVGECYCHGIMEKEVAGNFIGDNIILI